jgi:Endonuclease/Exonuclease/phosphatase family
VANSRYDWTGWLELAKEPVDEVTTNMTAQVLLDVNADVQGVVEVEDRPSLDRFNKDLLGGHFEHVMLIDGNDTRGIDVGIMTSKNVEIESMHSNVDVPDPGAANERLFSRDCAEYLCRLPGKTKVRVLLNHFKSRSGGGGEKRARQAQEVRDIVDGPVASGEKNLIVMGDLNEGPDGQGNPSEHFAPLCSTYSGSTTPCSASSSPLIKGRSSTSRAMDSWCSSTILCLRTSMSSKPSAWRSPLRPYSPSWLCRGESRESRDNCFQANRGAPTEPANLAPFSCAHATTPGLSAGSSSRVLALIGLLHAQLAGHAHHGQKPPPPEPIMPNPCRGAPPSPLCPR